MTENIWTVTIALRERTGGIRVSESVLLAPGGHGYAQVLARAFAAAHLAAQECGVSVLTVHAQRGEGRAN